MLTPRRICFWIRVKKLIREQKTSQEKFAARIGININTLKFWMCYGYYPDVRTAYKIADVLNVPLDYLMKRKEKSAKEIIQPSGEQELEYYTTPP